MSPPCRTRPATKAPGLDSVQTSRPSLPLNGQSALWLLECSARRSLDSVVIFGPDGVCVWANQATASLLGISDCADLVGRLDLNRHCSVPGDAGGVALSQALAGQAQERLPLCYDLSAPAFSAEGGESGSQCPGKTLVVNAQLIPLLDESGGVAALGVFNRAPAPDSPSSISSGAPGQEDVRMQNSIATARAVARRLAHDFNNIIAVVQGYADLLKFRLTEDAEGRGMAELISQMGEEATAVTQRLASFANARPADLAEVDLNLVVADFVAGPRGVAPAGVQVHLELAPGLPLLLADAERLEGVCAYLWQNALDAMPSGGSVTWRTDLVSPVPGDAQLAHLPTGCFLRLRVADTGEGMDEVTRRSVFDPFFTTRHGKSRGLSLTEVYLMVKELHGFVGASSVPGAGTTMELIFPLREAAEQVQVVAKPVVKAQIAEALPAGSAQGPRWLVVDDEDLVRQLLEQLLLREGVAVVTAASGTEALTIFQSHAGEIDGVILDMSLGDLTGPQVFQRLREISPQVSVIIVSGDARQPGVSELVAQGGCLVLAKPFRREELAALLSQSAAWAGPDLRAAA